MKRLALLTAIAMATPAVAYAEPPQRNPYSGYDRDYERNRDRDRERARNQWSRDNRGRWVLIAQNYSAQTERQFINLLGKSGRYSKLRIEGVRGAPMIMKVAIEYMDRNTPTQVVHLNTRLGRGADQVINLNGNQRINRIGIYSEPRYRGSYSVFGT